MDETTGATASGQTPQQTPERTSHSIVGMPVLSINEGLPLGQIRQIIIDARTFQAIGFLVERHRFSRDERILPFAAVSGFGADTITVPRLAVLERKGNSQQYLRPLREAIPLLGERVFTAGGRTLGKVEEYRFRTDDGKICGLEIAGDGLFRSRSLIDGKYIIAISRQTVMVHDQAAEQAVTLENSLKNGMENAAGIVRSGAGNAGKMLNDMLSKWRREESSLLLPDAAATDADEMPADEMPAAATAATESKRAGSDAAGDGADVPATEPANQTAAP